MCGGSFRAFDKAMAYARDSFDDEGRRRETLRKMTQSKDAAIERIIANDAAFPAGFDKFVARDDGRSCLRKRYEHLHHARLKFHPLAISFCCKIGRAHPQFADSEVLLLGKINPLGPKLWPKISHDRQ